MVIVIKVVDVVVCIAAYEAIGSAKLIMK